VLVHFVFQNRIKGTFTAAILITLLIVIFSSISILIVEKSPDSNITTAEDAIWWALVTVTTVGYGDKYPVTTEGRLIAVILMFTGVGLFGVFTGYISSLFVNNRKEEKNTN
jgi:voltage-gated potassium channel